MRNHLDHYLRATIDWVFRRRSPAMFLVRAGLGIVALVLAGWAFSVSVPTPYGALSVNFDTGGSIPAALTYGLTILGVLLVVVGASWEFHRYSAEHRRLSRKMVLVIEARGLRDTSGTPLSEAVPNRLEGNREQLLVDLRQGIRDGAIIDPEVAVEKLLSLPVDIERRQAALDRRDLTLVYGGLTPVPLTFLTGVLIDDEGPVFVMDWDRQREKWRALDGDDDGRRFAIVGLEKVQTGSAVAILAVSVSYRVDVDAVRQKFPAVPLVHMELEDGSPNCHWSDKKQGALAMQFLETVIALGNKGAKRLYIFLASQNSVVFRFGRTYDKRNLPEAVVYQLERGSQNQYPWGVLMPVAGVQRAAVIRA